MATLTGSFTGPATTGNVTASGPLSVSFAGEVANLFVVVEQSSDGGTTWTPFWSYDAALGSRRDFTSDGANAFDVGGPTMLGQGRPTTPPPISDTWGVNRVTVGNKFRLRCTRFDSGWCNWSLTA